MLLRSWVLNSKSRTQSFYSKMTSNAFRKFGAPRPAEHKEVEVRTMHRGRLNIKNLRSVQCTEAGIQPVCKNVITITIMIIIFIYCNWVVTRWQWLFYMHTKHEIGYY
jgi:hypothetical protein